MTQATLTKRISMIHKTALLILIFSVFSMIVFSQDTSKVESTVIDKIQDTTVQNTINQLIQKKNTPIDTNTVDDWDALIWISERNYLWAYLRSKE
jgi:hypothetical protein